MIAEHSFSLFLMISSHIFIDVIRKNLFGMTKDLFIRQFLPINNQFVTLMEDLGFRALLMEHSMLPTGQSRSRSNFFQDINASIATNSQVSSYPTAKSLALLSLLKAVEMIGKWSNISA